MASGCGTQSQPIEWELADYEHAAATSTSLADENYSQLIWINSSANWGGISGQHYDTTSGSAFDGLSAVRTHRGPMRPSTSYRELVVALTTHQLLPLWHAIHIGQVVGNALMTVDTGFLARPKP